MAVALLQQCCIGNDSGHQRFGQMPLSQSICFDRPDVLGYSLLSILQSVQ